MSSFSKFVLIGVTALSAFGSVAAVASSDPAASRQQVLAAQRQVTGASPVAVSHKHHRHHHRAHRPVRGQQSHR